jgi:hypothetical protein
MTVRSLTSKRLEFATADEAIESYLQRGWTDGLPVVPPTPERVGDFLEYSGRPPSEIIGAEPTKGRVITAEKVAINAVMAGCLPEYGPVVLAAVEALCEPSFNLHAITVSTAGAAVLVAVNGPAASETGLNSGVSLFGPGHRANATIGRAVRLVIGNVTGAAPGVLDKATLGHAGKYTWCIAEAEETSPWEPLHVERGLPADQGAVTVFAGLSPIQVSNGESDRPEEILDSFTDAMFAAGPEQAEMVVVLSPEHVGHFEDAGWSKRQVKEYLYERARRPATEWAGAGAMAPPEGPNADALIPVVQAPEGVTVIVAGGLAGGFSDVIPLWGGGSNSRSVTTPVRRA